MDDSTTQTALLMEAAQSHRRIAEASLARLEHHTLGLDTVVRSAIRQAFTEEFQAVHAEARRAEAALRAVRWVANWEVALVSVVFALLVIAVAFAWRAFG